MTDTNERLINMQKDITLISERMARVETKVNVGVAIVSCLLTSFCATGVYMIIKVVFHM